MILNDDVDVIGDRGGNAGCDVFFLFLNDGQSCLLKTHIHIYGVVLCHGDCQKRRPYKRTSNQGTALLCL